MLDFKIIKKKRNEKSESFFLFSETYIKKNIKRKKEKINKNVCIKRNTKEEEEKNTFQATYSVFKTKTWWLFLANVTTNPSVVILSPQHRDTFT